MEPDPLVCALEGAGDALDSCLPVADYIDRVLHGQLVAVLAMGVDSGYGLFRTACGSWRGRRCRRRGFVRRAAGSRTSMARRSSPRLSTSWSAAARGGRCRRASGRRSRPCTAASPSGRGPGSGADCTGRFSNSWTGRTRSACPAQSSTQLMSALKRGALLQVRAPWTGVGPVPGCTSCRTRTDCPYASGSPRPTSTTARP